MTQRPSRTITPAAGLNTDWRGQGACRTADPDLFFPDGHTIPLRILEAKRICARCPIQVECRTSALKRREPYGVWGGLTEDERKVTLRKRNPARRQKAVARALDLSSPERPAAKPRRPAVVRVLETYGRVVQLRAQGLNQRSIARDLGTSSDALRVARQLVAQAGSAEAALKILVMAA
ncbi:WhiB family transcriptional regulator [Streptomyces sp. 8L]|uniref:WhiB family transcriptional regulator n=1 Tax=Streptomyces sp. 8L TaxID=2877242 RepID=UPI0035A98C0E